MFRMTPLAFGFIGLDQLARREVSNQVMQTVTLSCFDPIEQAVLKQGAEGLLRGIALRGPHRRRPIDIERLRIGSRHTRLDGRKDIAERAEHANGERPRQGTRHESFVEADFVPALARISHQGHTN